MAARHFHAGNRPAWSVRSHVFKARREVMEADVVVVNHHLLFADLALKQEGFGEILPGAAAFILDEAAPDSRARWPVLLEHQRGQLTDMAQDVLTNAAASPARSGLAAGTGGSAAGRAAQGGAAGRCRRAVLSRCWKIAPTCGPRCMAWASCGHAGRAARLAGRALARLRQPARTRRAVHNGWTGSSNRMATTTCASSHATGSGRADARPAQHPGRMDPHLGHAARRWQLRSLRAPARPGRAADAEPGRFDYARQALCYLPSGLPDPNARDYTEQVIDAVLPVLHCSNGRAFCCSPRTAHCVAPPKATSAHGRCLCRAPRRGLGCWRNSAPAATACCSARRVSGRRRRGRRGAQRGGDRQAAVRRPDDPVLMARLAALEQSGINPFTAAAAHAPSCSAGRRPPICSVHDRGVLVLRGPAPHQQGLRQTVPRQPAAHAPSLRGGLSLMMKTPRKTCRELRENGHGQDHRTRRHLLQSRDPAALSAWYAKHLGLDTEEWGGARFDEDEQRPGYTLRASPFAADTDYFGPGPQLHDQLPRRRPRRAPAQLHRGPTRRFERVRPLRLGSRDPEGTVSNCGSRRRNHLDGCRTLKREAMAVMNPISRPLPRGRTTNCAAASRSSIAPSSAAPAPTSNGYRRRLLGNRRLRQLLQPRARGSTCWNNVRPIPPNTTGSPATSTAANSGRKPTFSPTPWSRAELSRRSTIWRRHGGDWQIMFHQGTLIGMPWAAS